MHLMYGTEPRQHFDRFNIDVNYIVGKILAKVKVDVMKLSPVDGRKLEDVKLEDILPKCGEYFINCCLMPAIKKLSALEVKSDKEKMLIEILSERGLDIVNGNEKSPWLKSLIGAVRREINDVDKIVPTLLDLAGEVVSNKPYFAIKQIALRNFWYSKIHPKLSIPAKKFSVLVQNFMSAHGMSSKDAIDLGCRFSEMLLGDHELDGVIDTFALRKIARMQDYRSLKFAEIVRKCTVRSQILQNLPQYDFSHTVRSLISRNFPNY